MKCIYGKALTRYPSCYNNNWWEWQAGIVTKGHNDCVTWKGHTLKCIKCVDEIKMMHTYVLFHNTERYTPHPRRSHLVVLWNEQSLWMFLCAGPICQQVAWILGSKSELITKKESLSRDDRSSSSIRWPHDVAIDLPLSAFSFWQHFQNKMNHHAMHRWTVKRL